MLEGSWAVYGRAVQTALGFFWKSAWAFVLGYAVSAAIQTFLPRSRLSRRMGEADAGSIALAVLFGAISSSCRSWPSTPSITAGAWPCISPPSWTRALWRLLCCWISASRPSISCQVAGAESPRSSISGWITRSGSIMSFPGVAAALIYLARRHIRQHGDSAHRMDGSVETTAAFVAAAVVLTGLIALVVGPSA